MRGKAGDQEHGFHRMVPTDHEVRECGTPQDPGHRKTDIGLLRRHEEMGNCKKNEYNSLMTVCSGS